MITVTGNKGNRWSAITVRMGMYYTSVVLDYSMYDKKMVALAVYTRSPASYEGLKSFNLLQLPSVRTLKHYIDANLEVAGECMERLEKERKEYLLLKKQLKEKREKHMGTA